MHFRTILSGTLAALFVAGAAHAFETGGGIAMSSGPSFNLPGVSLPGLPGEQRGDARTQGPVRYAQAGDPRITQLEERIRSLSGTIEELNFQVLQMQEQIRKMQEDNEFRFQELEDGKTNASGPRQGSATPAPAKPAAPGKRTEADRSGSVEEIIVQDQTSGATGAGDTAAPDRGAPPQILGNVTFDAKGNVVGGADNPAAPRASAPAPRHGTDNTVVAALPSTNNPDELYRNSYEFILSGDYGTAEAGFKDHIARFPKDAKTADARFWLGEALLGQKRYRDAAETFLAANKEFPTSKKAPDMLLKLGVSLVGLEQKDVACATFAEIGKRYPDASGVLKERVKQEQAIAAC
jgi:tol-pal system protein YbgF